MPTYEYRCEACEHEFEEFQSITAAPLKKCPKCGRLRLRRLIGRGAAVIFRGSGFYQTDYRSDSYQKAAKAEKDASAGPSAEKSSDGKSKSSGAESQPAAAATAKSKPSTPASEKK